MALTKQFYLRNPNLKAVGVRHNFTKEQATEWIRCKNDIIYFAEKYVKIVDLDRGLINIKLYDFQKDFLHSFVRDRFVIVKCSRQIGKTVSYSIFCLHNMIFKDEYTVAILADKVTTAKKLLASIKKSYENLPMWLQRGVVEWNKNSIELENGSRTLVSATQSGNAVRGFAVNCVDIDSQVTVRNKKTGKIEYIKISELIGRLANVNTE
jgi:hypothetical protein